MGQHPCVTACLRTEKPQTIPSARKETGLATSTLFILRQGIPLGCHPKHEPPIMTWRYVASRLCDLGSVGPG